MRLKSLYLPFFVLALFFVACDNQEEVDTADHSTEEPVVASEDARFRLLPSDATGLKFSNTIKETFQNNILINSYLYNGGGVAVIDVNNDGLQDLYFSATQQENRLYLNKGDWKFEDITEKAGVAALGGSKTGVTVVDINADGFQDIYVCRSGMQPDELRANLLYINNGDLTFTEQAAAYQLDDRSASNHANFFDYDLDGDLDVYVLNHPVDFAKVNSVSVQPDGDDFIRNTAPLNEWDSDKLFRNNGDGTFTNVSQSAGINNRAWGLSVTVTDFNRDRYPDLFVGNDYIEPDLVYINNRNGTFSIETDRYFRHMSNHTMGVDIADFNNDGLVDVVALDMIAEDNQRQKELMTTMTLDRYNNLVRFHYGHQLMRNVLQLNTGRTADQGNVFSDIGVLAGVWNTDWSWSPLLADFDNDGLKDLYITNGYRRDISNLDYLTYTVPREVPGGKLDPRKFADIEDYLKLIPSTPLQNYMFRNVDGLRFEKANASWGMTEAGYSNGSAYADLDNDGDLDLLVNNIHGDIMVYRNRTNELNGGNWLQVDCKGSGKNTFGTGARVRITYGNGNIQYQELTPVRGFFSSSQPVLHFGLKGYDRVDRLEVQWPADGRIQVMTDVAVNQRITLDHSNAVRGNWEAEPLPEPLFREVKNTGLDFRHRENDFEDFNRERLLPHRFSNLGPGMAVADVNGDGLEDLFIGGARDQQGALYLQNKRGTFAPRSGQGWETDARYEDMGAVFFDAEGDGDPDLYVISGGSSYEANSDSFQDRLYLNDGTGKFSKTTDALPSMYSSGSCVAVSDVDEDGDPDLVVGGRVTPGLYPQAPVTCLLINEGGRFTDYCSQLAPGLQQLGMINDLKWSDLDGDGSEELLVAGEWLPVTVFKKQEGKLVNATDAYGLSGSTGWWNCLKTADLDGDGDQDIVAGNLGLNSRLQASETEPLTLYAGDFDKNGSIDPVLAYYNGGKLYPLPLRDMMIKQMPSLKKKFVYYKDYGKSTIEDVFSKNDLESATKLEAKTLVTSWFENRNGQFVQHVLHTAAQVAPCNDIVIEDFNSDGRPDLLLVGNTSSPDVETGRYDAGNGTLLLGTDGGPFEFVPNRKHGFWATREARDMAQIKRADGNRLYLVANNNDVVEVFTMVGPSVQ